MTQAKPIGIVLARKGQAQEMHSRETFRTRFLARFADPAYEAEREAIARLEAIAWSAYHEERKWPRRAPAGPGFAEPDYPLGVEWLETSQRLRDHARAVATAEQNPHPGRTLLDAALAGGAQASGRRIGAIVPGHRADMVELDETHPLLLGRSGDALLDAWVFSGQDNPVRSVVCGGKAVVEAGRHLRAMEIRDAFGAAMRRLLG
jgi:hypothetical protein